MKRAIDGTVAPRTPWRGWAAWRAWAATPEDRLCIAVYAFTRIYRLALWPLTPALIGTHPVLLAALQGGMGAMVAAGAFARVGRTSLWLALLAGLVGVTLFDPVTWWVGRRFGPRVLDRFARRKDGNARRIERAERFVRRWGSWTLVVENYQPLPNDVLYLIIGASGMPLTRFVALDLIGELLWVVPVVALGYAIGGRAVTVAQTISHYALWLGLGAIAAVVVHAVLRRRKGRGRAE